MTRSWGVLGGGMLGMTLARELRKQGFEVTLCEAAPEIGGLAGAWQLGDVVWDRHYHVTLLSDSALRGLLAELGLEREIRWTETRTGFYSDGRLHSMSNSWEFVRFPPLGLLDKARLAFTILYASRITDGRELEDVSAEAWLTRLSGRRTFEKIWRPLLRSKLGDNAGIASAAFIWATIRRMYAARREGLKKEMFGYVPGGYARILERFQQSLLADGVTIKLSAAACQVRREPDGGFEVRLANGAAERFERVVLTMPGCVAARLCGDLPEAERAAWNAVRYQGIVCASVLLKKPLAGFYVTNITDAGLPFTGVIEMSALVDRAQFGGHSLVYLPRYLPSDHAAFGLPDQEWRAMFMAGLRRMYPAFEEDDVAAFRISRARHVFAIPSLHYSRNLPASRTSAPGLYILNSSHIVNGTLNVNETIELARRGARMLTAECA